MLKLENISDAYLGPLQHIRSIPLWQLGSGLKLLTNVTEMSIFVVGS